MLTLPATCYITGTDTGIGKTHVTAALLAAGREKGLDCVGMKPIASGCIETDAGWRSEDALAHAAADGRHDIPYALRNPYALPLPLAPELAARAAGVTLALEPIRAAFSQLQARASHVLVEGVGGWAAPLSATLEQADVVRALRLPVLLVVGLRLGCLHQARVTWRAIGADGCTPLGWVANPVDATMAAMEENLAILQRLLGCAPLAVLPRSG